MFMSDTSFESIDHVAEHKSTVYRTKYLSTKSEVKGNPTESQQNVWDHLNNFGLDTIVYLPDPKYRTKAICTVTHHVQLTDYMRLVESLAAFTMLKFDAWDRRNDSKTKDLSLKASLNPSRRTSNHFMVKLKTAL